MGFYRGPNLVTDGLVVALDAGNTKSYPGSGTVFYDKSGYGNNGSLVNGPTFSSSNMGGILLDGTNDTIDITSTSYTEMSNVLPWSFSFTFKINVLPSATDIDFIRKGSSTTTGFFMFYRSPTLTTSTIGQVFMRHNATLRNAGTVDVTGINTVVVTYAGSGNMLCYVNGVSLGNFGAMTGFSTGTNIQMGLGNIYLNGYVYNFLKYDKQLSDVEVLQNYNATKSRFNI